MGLIINANSLNFSMKVHYGYSQTCVKGPYKSLAFRTDGCLLLYDYFHAVMSNHLSIAISMSPEWMVA